jgi:general secretion pathway protein N
MTASKRLVAAGLATFIIGIVLTFPARIAYNWFAPPEIRLTGISGTVWRGQAAEGSAGGIYLRNLQWNFLPSRLIRGQLAYAIASESAFGAFRSEVGVGVGDTVRLTNVDSSLSLAAFSDLFQLNGFEGTLQIRFDTLTLQDGLPADASGSIRLSNLLAPQLSPLVIGDYLAEFSGSADGIVASVEDTGGVLDVAGTITVRGDRSYAFVGKIATLPDAPPGLTEQLRFLGSPDDRGYRDFRVEGRL